MVALAPAAGSARADEAAASASAIEEIYVLRSVRDTRKAPGEFCSKLDAPTSEDTYSFFTPEVDSGNGRVTSAKVKSAGNIHGCFGKSADPGVMKFYGEFEAAGVPGKAIGECRSGKPDYPEMGFRLFSCLFDLSELPPPYTGGMLTTNSVNSRAITGDVSEPDGYTQVSIATVRLWKKRAP